jgi:hypothetical protein
MTCKCCSLPKAQALCTVPELPVTYIQEVKERILNYNSAVDW